jgi:hydroxyacylglutathione hydrolase
VYFRQLLHDERSCASYIVGCPNRQVAAVIDPQGDPQRYIHELESNAMTITHVIDTHVHADHESSARALAGAVDATHFLGSGAEVGFDFTPLEHGDVLEVGNRQAQVIHVPGHTPEHVALFFDDWFVLTGDTLFVGDVGRVDLALVEVYPGHYAGSTCGRGMDGKTISTIGRERRTNPALQLDPEHFLDYQLANTPPLPQDFLRIKTANKS